MSALKIGADPELFINGTDGQVRSAFQLIPGTKHAPHPVNKGAVQVDGMALEFNIDPVEDEDTFVTNINTVMGELRKMVPKEFVFSQQAVAHFPKGFMNNQPNAARELGCDPDFNAYYAQENPAPPYETKDVRTAAGHVHIGWTEGEDPHGKAHFLNACALARQLDFFLGAPALLIGDSTERHDVYGKAGAFRPRPYGMEYRVLGNFWLNEDKLKRWVYRNAVRAYHTLVDDGIDLYAKFGDMAKEALDRGDTYDITKMVRGPLKDFKVLEGAQ